MVSHGMLPLAVTMFIAMMESSVVRSPRFGQPILHREGQDPWMKREGERRAYSCKIFKEETESESYVVRKRGHYFALLR